MTPKFSSRRSFLKAGAMAAVTSPLALKQAAFADDETPKVHAAEDNVLKVGLVGCGGRGLGALKDTLNADPNTKLVAVGDAFPDKAAAVVKALEKHPAFEGRIDVKPELVCSGLDNYKQVIDACDVVLLCQPPAFRPESFHYAIEKGKHCFVEKPVAVDGAGVKSVLETAKIAQEKKLVVVSGLCWRYDLNVLDMMKRVQDGAVGDILSVRETYMTGILWTKKREQDDTELQFQVRNWYNFTWLSGDYNVEQHVHSLDKALWANGNKPPQYAYGIGGRMARTDQPACGDIYDAMGVVYEYEDGRSIYAFSRQQSGCWNETDDHILGTKGIAHILSGRITGENPYQQKKVNSNMFLLEHQAMYESIRGGNYINNGEYMANSTMLGIFGRLTCYTGKRLKWDDALNLETPTQLSGSDWNTVPPTVPDDQGRYKIAVPGKGYVYHQVVR